MEVLRACSATVAAVRLYREQVRSLGRQTMAWLEDRVRFWAAIARETQTEEVAVGAGAYVRLQDAENQPQCVLTFHKSAWRPAKGARPPQQR